MKALIGTGFCATSEKDYDVKFEFFRNVWQPNTGERDVVMVDNTDEEIGMKVAFADRTRIISVNKNLGHVGQHLGAYRPHLLGFSLSWIIPALVAYSEQRDFIYKEADCLAFGSWEESILKDMEERNLQMAYGEGSKWACTEQSLFYIKWEFLSEAIWSYLSIPDGDGKILPEDKFRMMSERNMRVGKFSIGCGRSRPIDYDAAAWYAQKFSDEEMQELRARKLI